MQTFWKRKYKCFYCNSSESFSIDFICSECGSRNLYTKDGTILDSQCEDKNIRYCSTKSIFKESVFCDVCIDHQNIVLSILQSRDEEVDLELKLDLEKRYPPVCKDCEPRVELLLELKYKSPVRKVVLEQLVEKKPFSIYYWLLGISLLGTFMIPIAYLYTIDYHFYPFLIALITLNYFYRDQKSIFVKQQHPSLWIPVLSLSCSISAIYYSFSLVLVTISVITILQTLLHFKMVQRLFKRAPVISTLKLDSGIAIEPEPIQSKPLNPNIIQESIESLTLSKPKPSQRTNSIWKTSSTSTVPWHAKQGSLPTVSVPQLRLDTNPDSIHFNMFRNAFGKRLEKKQDVQVVPVQSKSEEEVEFRPQRFFAKQEDTGLEDLLSSFSLKEKKGWFNWKS